MLETVREFAAEQLAELPGHDRVRAAHASAFRALAEDLPRPPAGPGRVGLDLLEREHDNFRAALDRYAATEPGTALRLANRLTAFWSIRGHFSEGRRRLAELLERVPDDDPERVDALNGAAWLATDQGDRAAAVPLLDETLARARAAGDLAGEATVLYYRGRATAMLGDPAGRADIERALELQIEAEPRPPAREQPPSAAQLCHSDRPPTTSALRPPPRDRGQLLAGPDGVNPQPRSRLPDQLVTASMGSSTSPPAGSGAQRG
jgi:non-specific serine/threonine protein kinase